MNKEHNYLKYEKVEYLKRKIISAQYVWPKG